MTALLLLGMPESLRFIEGPQQPLLGPLAIALVFAVSMFLRKGPPTQAEENTLLIHTKSIRQSLRLPEYINHVAIQIWRQCGYIYIYSTCFYYPPSVMRFHHWSLGVVLTVSSISVTVRQNTDRYKMLQ
jgi:hypothetical protein